MANFINSAIDSTTTIGTVVRVGELIVEAATLGIGVKTLYNTEKIKKTLASESSVSESRNSSNVKRLNAIYGINNDIARAVGVVPPQSVAPQQAQSSQPQQVPPQGYPQNGGSASNG